MAIKKCQAYEVLVLRSSESDNVLAASFDFETHELNAKANVTFNAKPFGGNCDT